MVQADVLIAHLDSGVQFTHPDLISNIEYNLIEQGNDEDNSGIIGDYWGASMIDDPNDSCYLGGAGDPTDCTGHGTGTASVLGAVGNNAGSLPDGSWLAGGAWKCRILPVKILSTASGLESRAVKGMDYANAGRGVRLMSCSWVISNSGSPPLALKEFITETPEALYVFGAANDTIDLDGIHPLCPYHYYPQEFDMYNLLVVGASNVADEMWGAFWGDQCHFEAGSNWGHKSVDLFAPGQAVPVLRSTPNPPQNCNNAGGLYISDGTSHAAPLVAAAAALVWTQAPSLSAKEVKDRIMNTVDFIPALAGRCVTGYPTCGGRLNVAKAIGHPTCNTVTCSP